LNQLFENDKNETEISGHNYKNLKAVGFLLKYTHDRKYPAIRAWMNQENDTKIVHLIRANVLMRKIANASRKTTGVSFTAKETEPTSVTLNPNAIIKVLRKNVEKIDEAKKRWSSLNADYMEVTYESLLSPDNNGFDQVLDFLEVGIDAELSCDVAKLEPESPRQLIKNYEEIAVQLQGMEFARYLD
jgi:LPS sulfotransferase NodH